ncbi:MAG: hypothetical protein WKF94_09760 [Solirubrobacteraceae bacterium]
MTRKSLRPHLNQIRTWVRQGRTDAWIAHQLEVTVQQIGTFKREQELAADGEAPTDEVDLRASDDEAIAAELEAEAARRAEEEAEAARKAEEEAAAKEAAGESEDDAPDADAAPAPKRRARRGGRRRKSQQPFEGTFDHGDEGYGLWLDPGVEDDPIYAEHWAGHRSVEVTVEEDQIVIRRAGGDADAS